MLPCPFFLDGRCRFSESSCKFSHGEVVSLNSLREYEEPDFSSLAEGSGVLAKDISDHLWHHATVEGKGPFINRQSSDKTTPKNFK